MRKKEELINALYRRLDEECWDIINKLLGRNIPNKESTRKNLLSKIFKKTIGISSRKGKARDLQKWVCEQISKLTGFPYGKDEEIASREMGQSGVDVRLSKNILKIFPFSVECKNQESWSLPSFILQAKKNQLPETDWLLFLTKNNHEEIVVLDGLVFFKLLRGK